MMLMLRVARRRFRNWLIWSTIDYPGWLTQYRSFPGKQYRTGLDWPHS